MPNSVPPAAEFTRRGFLRGAAAFAGLALPLDGTYAGNWLTQGANPPDVNNRTDEDLAGDETYWGQVRAAYQLNPDIINFDHGWTNPTVHIATDALAARAQQLEALPAELLESWWHTGGFSGLRSPVAAAMSLPPDEIALVRNATEALDTVLLGVPLRPGDEIVCSGHDYFAILDALHQRQARDGVVLRILDPPVPAPSMDSLERLYAEAIGPKTRLVLLTHPSNRTGQLLPVRKIAERAHAAGAEVVVDGAQSLGILEDPVRSLNCDYYGASLHKWIGTPVGIGVLWMRPELTEKVWPLIPAPASQKGIKKFEWVGTAPLYINVAAIPAVEWHRAIGAKRKAARLRYLSRQIRAKVRAAASDAKFYAIDAPDMTCGLTTVEIAGVDPGALQQGLRQRHGILVQDVSNPLYGPTVRGVRISPNVYATAAEIDRFERALAAEVSLLRSHS